ncbi:MAG: hypothetical protein RIF32_10150 [Leptospirales bacterium]|jgi:hypothetical protein
MNTQSHIPLIPPGRRLWRRNPPLALTGGVMLIALALMIPAIWLDPRIVNGEAVWIKPAKFALSIALYSFTLLWILNFVQGSPRVQKIARAAGWVIALMFLIEVIAIFGQAARGRSSHFNNATIVDGVIFNVMGAAITILFVMHLAISYVLLRPADGERVLASGLRTGMLVAALGMAVGYLMVSPSAEQIAVLAEGRTPQKIGGHAVGAPDGGPGIPLSGWSATAGDLRVAHFFGMHAMQLLPLFALWLRRWPSGNSDRKRAYVRIAAGVYAGITILLTVQALRGESIAQTGAETFGAFAALIALGMLAAWRAAARHGREAKLLQQSEASPFRDGGAPGVHV